MEKLLRSMAVDDSLPAFYREYARELSDDWHRGNDRPADVAAPVIVLSDDLSGEPSALPQRRKRVAVTDRIEAVCRQIAARGPMTVTQIADRTDMSLSQVQYTLQCGRFHCEGVGRGTRWHLPIACDNLLNQPVAP